nr:hypothetical protein [candidate division Zixibacteria bacterium]
MTPDEEKEREQLSLELNIPSGTAGPDTAVQKPDGKVLEWVCHPARRNMRTTILVSFFLAVVVVVVYLATDNSVWFSILASLFLFGSLSSFYFPSHYRLTEEEIIVKTKMQTMVKKWSQYRTSYPDKNGILLSPFTRRSRLENFRGIYIKFEGNRDEVIAFAREMMTRSREDGG